MNEDSKEEVYIDIEEEEHLEKESSSSEIEVLDDDDEEIIESEEAYEDDENKEISKDESDILDDEESEVHEDDENKENSEEDEIEVLEDEVNKEPSKDDSGSDGVEEEEQQMDFSDEKSECEVISDTSDMKEIEEDIVEDEQKSEGDLDVVETDEDEEKSDDHLDVTGSETNVDEEKSEDNLDVTGTGSLQSSDNEMSEDERKNITVALTPSSRKSLIADVVKEQESFDVDETNVIECEEEKVVESKEADVETPPPHDVTIALSSHDRKSLISDLVKHNFQDSPSEEEQEAFQREKDEDITFNFSPPDEKTVALSAEMRKSLVQSIAKKHEEPVCEVIVEEFKFTDPQEANVIEAEEEKIIENIEVEAVSDLVKHSPNEEEQEEIQKEKDISFPTEDQRKHDSEISKSISKPSSYEISLNIEEKGEVAKIEESKSGESFDLQLEDDIEEEIAKEVTTQEAEKVEQELEEHEITVAPPTPTFSTDNIENPIYKEKDSNAEPIILLEKNVEVDKSTSEDNNEFVKAEVSKENSKDSVEEQQIDLSEVEDRVISIETETEAVALFGDIMQHVSEEMPQEMEDAPDIQDIQGELEITFDFDPPDEEVKLSPSMRKSLIASMVQENLQSFSFTEPTEVEKVKYESNPSSPSRSKRSPKKTQKLLEAEETDELLRVRRRSRSSSQSSDDKAETKSTSTIFAKSYEPKEDASKDVDNSKKDDILKNASSENVSITDTVKTVIEDNKIKSDNSDKTSQISDDISKKELQSSTYDDVKETTENVDLTVESSEIKRKRGRPRKNEPIPIETIAEIPSSEDIMESSQKMSENNKKLQTSTTDVTESPKKVDPTVESSDIKKKRGRPYKKQPIPIETIEKVSSSTKDIKVSSQVVCEKEPQLSSIDPVKDDPSIESSEIKRKRGRPRKIEPVPIETIEDIKNSPQKISKKENVATPLRRTKRVSQDSKSEAENVVKSVDLKLSDEVQKDEDKIALTPSRRIRRVSQDSKSSAENVTKTQKQTDKIALTPSRRSQRVSQDSITKSDHHEKQTTPKKSSKKVVTSSEVDTPLKSSKEIQKVEEKILTPSRRSRRVSQDSLKSDQEVKVTSKNPSPKKVAPSDNDMQTPSKRSRRRSSQSSDGEAEKSTSRPNTPISSSKKKSKVNTMKTLVEDDRESETDEKSK